MRNFIWRANASFLQSLRVSRQIPKFVVRVTIIHHHRHCSGKICQSTFYLLLHTKRNDNAHDSIPRLVST
jgi:hypothetical protein